MSGRSSGTYKLPLLLFLSILIIFLVVVNLFLVTRQHELLFENARNELSNEMELISIFVREPLLRHDYDEVEQFLFQWEEEHDEILSIKAAMPNGFVLVQSNKFEDGKHSYKLEKQVEYLNRHLITIEIVKDFTPVRKILGALQRQLIAGSIILTILFGFILWFTMKHFAVKPLEQEIDRRREAEENLLEIKKGLEVIVKERTKELIDKNKELEQIVYVTSHDLRSPLINIEGYNKVIGKAIGEVASVLESSEVSAEIKNKVSAIVKEDMVNAEKYISSSIVKMEVLINGLLQISRLGRIELKKERLDMNDIIFDITNAMKYQLQQADVKLDVSDLPSCTGDRSQISQLFSNLLDNSVKFLDPARQGIISISGSTQDNQSVYRIEDNGIGVAQEHQGKIFEIFHKLLPGKDGEGLGLSIVRKIIDRHQGKILVESEKGKGSKFIIYLTRA